MLLTKFKHKKAQKQKPRKAPKKLKQVPRQEQRQAKQPGQAKEPGQRQEKKQAASIEFCDKCSSIMIPIKKGQSTYLKCRRCGTEKRRDVKTLKIVEEQKNHGGVTILEKDTVPLPMVEMKCEQCNHSHAYFWMQQTRSADEPPTQFFRCVKCKYTWREYK